MTELAGKTLGAYRVIERIGRGGMATVYRAYHAAMNRDVAIKVLPEEYADDADFRARFEREAQVVANLRHPYILPVFDYGEDHHISYIVMPYIPTGTLKNFLLENKILAYDIIIPIIKHLGEALDYAHNQGVIHRDIKPDNVLFDENRNPLLTDFGLTRMMAGSASLTGTGIIGTPAYMSPEQGQGMQLDHRSDIYSLGIMLYEMVTGDVPFNADTPVAVIFKHVSDPLPIPCKRRNDLPEQAQNVILKALAKSPEDRWETCLAMTSAFSHAIIQQAAQPIGTIPGHEDDTHQTITGIQSAMPPIPDTPTEILGRSAPTILVANEQSVHKYDVLAIDDDYAKAIADEKSPGIENDAKANEARQTIHENQKSSGYPVKRMLGLIVIIVILFALTLLSSMYDHALSVEITAQPPINESSTSQDGDLDTALAFTGTFNDDWQPIIRDFNGVKMVLVPAGCFMMGSTRVEDEEPVHEQCFDEPFWIDQFEVTNQQFASFNGIKADDRIQTTDNHPVENITWYEALNFCKSRGAALPTEAQWEYAARGVESWEFPWGNEFEPTYLVYDGGADLAISSAVVGTYPAGVSWVGAYDMLGNVSEWTSSLYQPYPFKVQPIDTNRLMETDRVVLRGGSWADASPIVLRSAYRTVASPNDHFYNGLRCVDIPR